MTTTRKRKWVKQRDLKTGLTKGMILRAKVFLPGNPRHGQYAYAVCSGTGFGCSPMTHGSAIYVDHETWDLEEAIRDRDKPRDATTGSRWERNWGIDVLVEGDQ